MKKLISIALLLACGSAIAAQPQCPSIQEIYNNATKLDRIYDQNNPANDGSGDRADASDGEVFSSTPFMSQKADWFLLVNPGEISDADKISFAISAAQAVTKLTVTVNLEEDAGEAETICGYSPASINDTNVFAVHRSGFSAKPTMYLQKLLQQKVAIA